MVFSGSFEPRRSIVVLVERMDELSVLLYALRDSWGGALLDCLDLFKQHIVFPTRFRGERCSDRRKKRLLFFRWTRYFCREILSSGIAFPT
jgi:hypothetical protein